MGRKDFLKNLLFCLSPLFVPTLSYFSNDFYSKLYNRLEYEKCGQSTVKEISNSFDDEDFKISTKFYPIPTLEPIINLIVYDLVRNNKL